MRQTTTWIGVGAIVLLGACGSDSGDSSSSGETSASDTSAGPTGPSSSDTSPSTSSPSTSSPSTSSPSTSDTTNPTGSSDTNDTGTTGSSTLDCTAQWSSGFEQGFPGEWLDYDNGSYSPDGSLPAGRVSAWTIIGPGDGEPILAGDAGYKGWIVDAAAESHRAYPVVHTDIETPVVNTFFVYLDADYDVMGSSEWIHFGTWGNDDGNGGGKWALHTMSVRDRKLEFAHTEPFNGEYIGPEPQPDFPRNQWVRFTAYLHYEGNTGFVQVWQDGVAMLRADVSELANFPGTALTRGHWGMYASAETTQGIQYNDDIQLWTLDAPLQDLDTEPDCYLGP